MSELYGLRPVQLESVSSLSGDDSEKHKLNAALPQIFAACKQYYLSNPDMTGAELYAFVCRCIQHLRLALRSAQKHLMQCLTRSDDWNPVILILTVVCNLHMGVLCSFCMLVMQLIAFQAAGQMGDERQEVWTCSTSLCYMLQ